MNFDEWERTHSPMQHESPNAYARRAFNAGVRSRHRIESVGDNQAECAPRYAVRLFKDALIDRFDQYPIPSQLGVTAIMKVIKQFHDGYTAPQAECARRDRASSMPGGCECSTCGRVFIGGPAHSECGECAPREAQPRMVVLPNPDTTYSAPWAGHTFKYHSNDQIVEYANACVKAAAPTPERAQDSSSDSTFMTRWSPEQIAAISAEKVARAQEPAGVLTDDQIREIWMRETGTTEQDSPLAILDFARAVLAKKEGA